MSEPQEAVIEPTGHCALCSGTKFSDGTEYHSGLCVKFRELEASYYRLCSLVNKMQNTLIEAGLMPENRS